MASSSTPPTSVGSAEDPNQNLPKKIRSHQIAIAELKSLSSTRVSPCSTDGIKSMAVYQKNGNIFFRTSIKSATAAEQSQLDLAKAQLQKLNSG